MPGGVDMYTHMQKHKKARVQRPSERDNRMSCSPKSSSAILWPQNVFERD